MAAKLAALGNQTRLSVFRFLVRAGRDGLNVGEIQMRAGIAASTLAHHLATLRQAGLIEQTKYGREVICVADYQAMDRLVAYLTDECCADIGGVQPARKDQETIR